MSAETRNCQNCKSEFRIEPEDFAFYKKINVLPPTFCPQCRFQRRVAFRNERNLFRRKSAKSDKDILALYPPETNFPVMEQEEWWADDWDALEFGRGYDFGRPFFEQLSELSSKVPRPARSVVNMVNSDYSGNAGYLKNCYLLFNSSYSEDCSYGNAIDYCKGCVDNSHISYCERSYGSFWMEKSYQSYFSVQCNDCASVWFSKNCRGCTDCLGCVNLRSQKYCIFNEQYSKEEYEKKIEEMQLDTWSGLQAAREKAHAFWLKFPVKFMQGTRNTNVTGEYVENSKNVRYGYLVREGENLKYSQYLQAAPNRDCHDFSIWGNNNELGYENCVCGYGTSNIHFCWECYNESRDMEYCMGCMNSSDLFACVGLRNKRFCIFNKQYSEEEYKDLRTKIIAHMDEMPYTDQKGNVYKYGEFFPPQLSPFGYNETVAQEHFPLSKEEAQKAGFQWVEKKKGEYEITKQAQDLPDAIGDVDDSILKEVIACAECGYAYRIISEELNFLRQEKLPLPRSCVDCRHAARIAFRNKSKLYVRSCQCAGAASDKDVYKNTASAHPTHEAGEHCPNRFETAYAEDRPEIVYCEDCYQAEVA